MRSKVTHSAALMWRNTKLVRVQSFEKIGLKCRINKNRQEYRAFIIAVRTDIRKIGQSSGRF